MRRSRNETTFCCETKMRVLVFFLCLWMSRGMEFHDKSDRYLIACHTTDFECFKRQYTALRDHVLLGNRQLAIEKFQPYSVQYGDNCVQFTGWEESQLVAIGMDRKTKELTLALALPVHIQQVENATACAKPERDFTDIAEHTPENGTLLEFTANATVTVTYPYSLLKKKGDVYLILDEEDLDAFVDIPIYELEGNEAQAAALNRASDWANSLINHVEPAQAFAVPFTSRLRLAFQRIPLKRLILLYPEEDYFDLDFVFIEYEK